MNEREPNFCYHCGAKLQPGSHFCSQCGTKVYLRDDEPPTAEPGLPAERRAHEPQSEPLTHTVQRPPVPPKKPEKKPHKPMKAKTKRVLGVTALVVLVIGLAIYGLKDQIKYAMYDVTLTSPQQINLYLDTTKQLEYQAEIGNESTNILQWRSSDEGVAHVDSHGKVKAVRDGTATISVAVGGMVKDSCTVTVKLKPAEIRNGQMVIRPNRVNYPEITVNAPSGENCYVYFENQHTKGNSFSFYVAAGRSATVNAPTGTYQMYYATGDTWYGSTYKFGRETNFYKSDDIFTLSEDSTSYDTLELTLYAVPNGNMDTDPIDEDEFPV